MNQQLLRRAWDALDSFKQAYPENWHEDDEQVMLDLMRADMKMSGVQPKWVGLTDEEIELAFRTNSVMVDNGNAYMVAGLRAVNIAQAIEAKLKEKNSA